MSEASLPAPQAAQTSVLPAIPDLSGAMRVYFQDGCLYFVQYARCATQPTVNLYMNNRPVPRTTRYTSTVVKEGDEYVITYKIMQVSMRPGSSPPYLPECLLVIHCSV